MMVVGTRVLVLAADLFEDLELLYPVTRLAEEGAGVVIAGLDGSPVTGKMGHGPVSVDTTVDEVSDRDFDALVIPGGYAPDKLRRSRRVLDLVRAFHATGKPIAFICHAGWVMISAGILQGRRATSVRAIRDDMINAGVKWSDEATVVDGNLISARTPEDLGPWMRTLLAALSLGFADAPATEAPPDPRGPPAPVTYPSTEPPVMEMPPDSVVPSSPPQRRKAIVLERLEASNRRNDLLAIHDCHDVVVAELDLPDTADAMPPTEPEGYSLTWRMVALFLFDNDRVVEERVRVLEFLEPAAWPG